MSETPKPKPDCPHCNGTGKYWNGVYMICICITEASVTKAEPPRKAYSDPKGGPEFDAP